MNLLGKQKTFSVLLARLILECERRGYEVTLGEAWRSPEEAKRNTEAGTGIQNSLHCVRLAIDLNLFRDGQFLTRTSDYQEIGDVWKSYSTEEIDCCWGGDFDDGNHFSVSHQGVR